MVGTYVALIHLTPQGIANLKGLPEGIELVHTAIDKAGGKVLGCYGVMGPYDFVAIHELPSDEVAVTLALRFGANGSYRTTTLKAFPHPDFVELVIAAAEAQAEPPRQGAPTRRRRATLVHRMR
jgi:uncharacterized protein with GYD domain